LVLDGYIRVAKSARRERFVSADLQRAQIEAWARTHETSLATVYVELDRSGERRLLLEALERVEAGETDGVIVAKLERLGRTAIEALQTIRRLEEAGGTLVSVQDGFDLGTTVGGRILRALVTVCEWELSPDKVAGAGEGGPSPRRWP
jgi:DNA invertase Pin-like site-specific DNA recombinase